MAEEAKKHIITPKIPNPEYSIVIPVYNAIPQFKQCLETVMTNTQDSAEIIVVDNGSELPVSTITMEAQRRDDRIIYTRYQNPLGYAGAVNEGIKTAHGKYVVLLNSDTLILDNTWLDRLRKPFVDDPAVGITGVISETMQEIKREFIIFFCAMISRQVIDTIGLLDTAFGVGAGEDTDFCYSKDTQIITRDGIKYIKDITYDDFILTLSATGILEYQKPTNLISKFEENLLHFKTQRLDLLVSKEQKLYVGYTYKSKGIYKPLDFISAENINNKLWHKQDRYYVKKNGGDWKGKTPKRIKVGAKKYDVELFVQFMAWYLSEGHANKRSTNRRGRDIVIGQKDANNCLEIENMLRQLQVKYSKYTPKSGMTIFRFADTAWHTYLTQFGKSAAKFIPAQIKDLAPKYLELFLNTYIKGDGNVNKNLDRFSLFTSSIQMRDDLLELLLKTKNTFSYFCAKGKPCTFSNGKTYNCRDVWYIQVYHKRKEKAILAPAAVVNYNDMTYDITVPNHLIYVIRNGKGCWSSNCFRAQDAGFKCVPCVPEYVNDEGQKRRVGNFPIFHIGESTVHTLSNWAEILKENTQKLRERYCKKENK